MAAARAAARAAVRAEAARAAAARAEAARAAAARAAARARAVVARAMATAAAVPKHRHRPPVSLVLCQTREDVELDTFQLLDKHRVTDQLLQEQWKMRT